LVEVGSEKEHEDEYRPRW